MSFWTHLNSFNSLLDRFHGPRGEHAINDWPSKNKLSNNSTWYLPKLSYDVHLWLYHVGFNPSAIRLTTPACPNPGEYKVCCRRFFRCDFRFWLEFIRTFARSKEKTMGFVLRGRIAYRTNHKTKTTYNKNRQLRRLYSVRLLLSIPHARAHHYHETANGEFK